MEEANDGQKAAECYVKRYFGGDKGEELETQKACQGGGDMGKDESEDRAGSDKYRDAGTETGDNQVG